MAIILVNYAKCLLGKHKVQITNFHNLIKLFSLVWHNTDRHACKNSKLIPILKRHNSEIIRDNSHNQRCKSDIFYHLLYFTEIEKNMLLLVVVKYYSQKLDVCLRQVKIWSTIYSKAGWASLIDVINQVGRDRIN